MAVRRNCFSLFFDFLLYFLNCYVTFCDDFAAFFEASWREGDGFIGECLY